MHPEEFAAFVLDSNESAKAMGRILFFQEGVKFAQDGTLGAKGGSCPDLRTDMGQVLDQLNPLENGVSAATFKENSEE